MTRTRTAAGTAWPRAPGQSDGAGFRFSDSDRVQFENLSAFDCVAIAVFMIFCNKALFQPSSTVSLGSSDVKRKQAVENQLSVGTETMNHFHPSVAIHCSDLRRQRPAVLALEVVLPHAPVPTAPAAPSLARRGCHRRHAGLCCSPTSGRPCSAACRVPKTHAAGHGLRKAASHSDWKHGHVRN